MEFTSEIVVIAGANGAGKSTCVSIYLPAGMAFLNADEVAKGLPGYPSPAVDIQAGRIVIEQMDHLENQGESFCVETTLATRSLASRIVRLRQKGYRFHLVYIWSPSPDFSIHRVAARVRAGGHHIPEETIRRRYFAGIRNFFQLYQPIADLWDVLDNSRTDGPIVIATGRLGEEPDIRNANLWQEILLRGNDGTA
jgi:predicted ABC-type ATPase